MPEPVYRDALTGQQDIASLERHQQRLLYGGGIFLTLIILVILGMSILQDVDNYRSEQMDDLWSAKLALDSLFVQRDAGYIRSLSLVEYAWRHKQEELEAKGRQSYASFIEHDDQAVVQASSHAAPVLVLGSGVDGWPQERIDRYLGLAGEMSVIFGTSLTARSKQTGTVAYFYDPSEALFAFGGHLESQELKRAMERSDRAALFSRLAAPDVNFENVDRLKQLREGNGALTFYSKSLPQVLTSVGKNPSTGEPSIIGTLVALDGDEPIGAFVVYESLSHFTDVLRNVARADMTVLTEDGQVAFDTGPAAESEKAVAAFKPLLALQQASKGIVHYRKGGRFFIAERIVGSNWMVVRSYGWGDLLRQQSTTILVESALALLVLAVLWALLIRQDRSVFAPMLRRARRVYQSDELNRTMIDTSPVGLCVIQKNDAMPLLQNDPVRSYAARVADARAEFYRQLLKDYADSAPSSDEHPDVREFGFVVPGIEGGNSKHLLVAAKPIVYRDRDALFCVLRDVTARVEIEENLRRARQDSEQARLAAESASRAKSVFVATMSHEIRTPLNGILGHLELLGHSKLEPAQRERLDRIRLSADALLAIISDVLDFSRIEAGQLDIDPVPFELRTLIEQTVLLYAPAAQRKGLKLYFTVEPGLARGYVADAHRIRQVLNNLVSNAVKFTESGRITVRVSSVPETEGHAPMLRFEVVDSGIGMTEEQLAQVFQPFSQADASISRRFGGSGLGLTLCHQLAELMGGSITARSAPGVGSVFSFDVPVAMDAKLPPVEPQPLHARRIVLLSAVAEWRAEIATLLSEWGADVTVAAQPAELDTDVVKQADALVIFGMELAWSGDDEIDLVAHSARVIRATIDGPLLPEERAGALYVSCYSSAALRSAIVQSASSRQENAEASAQLGRDVRDAARGRVLLADDNPVNRELIQQQLEALGYGVDSAEDGEAALGLWRDGRYAVVLTDINMPNMNGYELAQRLRARGVIQPILAVTATALISEKANCRNAGITDVLLKPISLDKLDKALSHYLSPARRQPPIKAAWANKYPEKVRRIFVESGTRDLDAVRAARRGSDQETLLSRLHSMKGALLMMGEKDVADQCAALEKQIDAAGIRAAAHELDRLESAMQELLLRYAEIS